MSPTHTHIYFGKSEKKLLNKKWIQIRNANECKTSEIEVTNNEWKYISYTLYKLRKNKFTVYCYILLSETRETSCCHKSNKILKLEYYLIYFML